MGVKALDDTVSLVEEIIIEQIESLVRLVHFALAFENQPIVSAIPSCFI